MMIVSVIALIDFVLVSDSAVDRTTETDRGERRVVGDGADDAQRPASKGNVFPLLALGMAMT